MNVNAYEYDSLDISKKKKIEIKAKNTKAFRINKFRLAVAIAKCTFTKNPDWRYGFSESIINILRVHTLLHTSSSNDLLLNKDRIELIRDFSKTTRIGELAQGVSFLFAQDELGIPTPNDFVGYFEKKFNKTPTGSTPDFIGSSSKGSYDLVESKGSLSDEDVIISRLRRALKQCDAGETILNNEGEPKPKRKFGVLSRFEHYDPIKTQASSIHYCDPDNEPPMEFNSWELIVNYYAAIVRGFTGMSFEQLRKYRSESVNFANRKFKMFHLGIETIDINDINIFLLSFGLNRRLEIGFSEEILELVSGNNREVDYFQIIKSIYESVKSNSENKNNNVYELFADGTLFRII